MRTYQIEKTSETSADTLLAAGFARWLGQLNKECRGEQGDIELRDAGSYYEIKTSIELSPEELASMRPFVALEPVVTSNTQKKEEKAGREHLPGFDYEAAKARREEYQERVKKLDAKERRPERLARRDDLDPPDRRLSHYGAIQQMKTGGSFNELISLWWDLGAWQGRYAWVILDFFSALPNDYAGAEQALKKLTKERHEKPDVAVTSLQLLNPTTGKGANYAKASKLSIGNQDSLWPVELLKACGFFLVAAPFVIQGEKDRKHYILQPGHIRLKRLEDLMNTFRRVCWSSTAVKLDILASLRFAQTFVWHRLDMFRKEAAEEDEFFGKELADLAHGFEVVSYKDMGSAYAMMNLATVNVPSWLSLASLEEAEKAEALLDEHLRIIQSIRSGRPNNEEGAEEYALLRAYRDFLSDHDLVPFWTFTTAYSSYLISKREHGTKMPQFSIEGLEELIAMSKQTNYSAIVQNEGFKRIAYAIRQSTVIAQFKRSQLKDRTYDVRYGLGQELMRDVSIPDKFIAALSIFLQQYSAETAREEEKEANRLGRTLTTQDRRAKSLRGPVGTDDIVALMSLIDEYGATTVCSLLVAYGYAREGRLKAADMSDDQGTEQAPGVMENV